MALSIKVRQAETVAVIEMTGRLVIGQPVDDVRDAICRLLDDGSRLFVLSLTGITHMDSVGLGQTISAYATVRERGGRVVLSSPSTRATLLLQMAKLLIVFDTYDSESKAVAALTELAQAGTKLRPPVLTPINT